MEEALIAELIASHGPWGIIVSLLITALIVMWRKQEKKDHANHEFAVSAVRAIEAANAGQAASTQALEEILRLSQKTLTGIEVIKAQNSTQ